MRRRWYVFLLGFVFILLMTDGYSVSADKGRGATLEGVSVGMSEQALLRKYPKKSARTYRQEGREAWMTFGVPRREAARGLVTFHIVEGKLKDWQLNDRVEVVREYLGEFCSQGIIHGMPVIYAAVRDVLERLAPADFLSLTDRHRPVLFTEYYDEGTARFANTSEIIASEDDAPAAEKGLTIIKLSSALGAAGGPEPVKGVIAHELAHRVLDHGRKGPVTCSSEREANALVRRWGFEAEFLAAKKAFGARAGEPASCKE
jgi:hypothetical protein